MGKGDKTRKMRQVEARRRKKRRTQKSVKETGGRSKRS